MDGYDTPQSVSDSSPGKNERKKIPLPLGSR